MTADENKIQISHTDIHEETQHTVTNDLLEIVVRCQKVNLRSTKGNTYERIYEIDFLKKRNVFDFEDDDFALKLSSASMESLLSAFMQEPTIRTIIQNYLKDHP